MRKLLSSLRASDPDDCERRVTAILDVGFEGIVIEPPMHEPTWQRLRERLPKNCAHALRLFLPYPQAIRKNQRVELGVSETSAPLRDEAIRLGLGSLEAADDLGARLVLLPVGRLDDESLPAHYVDPMRPLANTGGARGAESAARMSALFSTLSRLLDRADRYGLTLCLTPSQRPREIPAFEQCRAVFEEFAGARLGLWLDTARYPSELLDVPSIGASGAASAAATSFDARVLGLSCSDASGTAERLPLGEGEVEWTLLAGSLRGHEVWCADVDTAEVEDLEASLRFLEELAKEPTQEDEDALPRL